MKWIKLGKIFDPTEHQLANNCFEFAQSPQAVVFDNFIRIYFSSRQKDKIGKYLSHISFVDFSKDFQNLIKISNKTVIELGSLGSFDEHGIFPVNLLKENDTIYAFTTGWNRKISVSVDAAVGLAISNDGGETFRKTGKGPIFGPSLNEPFLVGDAFVQKLDDTYHAWYIYGSRWIVDESENEPQRIYKIVHAVSKDLLDWKKDGKHIISDKLNADECQALPTVIYFENRYHMFFCYRYATGFRKNKERSYRIGYAWSNNLKDWTRQDELTGIDVSVTGWDSEMLCYPHVFRCDDKIYMLYNGNEFGQFGFGLAVLE